MHTHLYLLVLLVQHSLEFIKVLQFDVDTFQLGLNELRNEPFDAPFFHVGNGLRLDRPGGETNPCGLSDIRAPRTRGVTCFEVVCARRKILLKQLIRMQPQV